MSDFVKVENISTVVTDTHIICISEFPNGKKYQVQISKDDLLIALKRIRHGRNQKI